jgi:hypothetical protein
MARGNLATEAVGQVERAARGAAHEARPWIVALARLGYAARGVVYAVVGLLALRAAFGAGGETTGAQGAIRTIGEQPFGKFLLGVVGLGLAGFALWKLIQAITNPERRTGGKGALLRLADVASGLIYAGLALAAFRMITGSGGGQGGDSARSWTAELMSKPFGRWLVVLAGVGILVYGLRMIQKAANDAFMRHLATGEMSPTERLWAHRAGKLGLAARGVVFVIIGGFLARAGLAANPGEARGLEGALDTLATQPYGPWLLALVALGLLAFGVYGLVEARYRRIAAP